MDKNIKNPLSEVFNDIESIINTKTVVGEPIKVKNTTIIPLVEVTCGMGVGEFSEKDDKKAGGMSTKMTPVAVIVVEEGFTKIINIKNQDAITKIIDLFPDLINKITKNDKLDKEVRDTIEDISEEYYEQ